MVSEFEIGQLVERLPAILFIGLLFGGWVIVAVVRAFTDSWRKVRQTEQDAALKQSMVEKGMTADDIERILNAGRSSRT
jgi:hypothetical protein